MKTFHEPQLVASLLQNEGVQKIISVFSDNDIPVRFVGGAVRNAFLQVPISDIDLATPIVPEESMLLLHKAGLHVVPTGIKHGTVTVYFQGQAFEITTLRSDVECHGRKATVAFTDDWQVDAARRDFTMNALSCSLDGIVYDYFNGVEDLRKGIVRFVGDPYDRIREDSLRILRFFRFSAYYSKGNPDISALEACKHHAISLTTLSGERLQNEMFKILSSPDPVSILNLMLEYSVLHIIFPPTPDFKPLTTLVQLEKNHMIPTSAIRRLALLLRSSEMENRSRMAVLLSRLWKLSRKQYQFLETLLHPETFLENNLSIADQKKAIRRWGDGLFREIVLLSWAEQEAKKNHNVAPYFSSMLTLAETWEVPTFPLSGYDLQNIGIAKGKQVGVVLNTIEQWWEEGGYIADREILLERAKNLL